MHNSFRSRAVPVLLLSLIGACPVALLGQTPTMTTLSLAPGTATTDQQVIVTANVSPAAADGLVEFNYNLPGQPFQAVFGLLSNGIAVASAGPIAATGTYSVQAFYQGRQNVNGTDYAPSHSDPAPLTIVAADGPAESSVAGQYAFLFQGFSNTANPYASAAAGSFTADGRGHITAGLMDLVTPAQVYRQVPITGSYTLENSGRGTLTLGSPGLPSQTMTFATTVTQALGGMQTANATPYNGGLFGSLRIAKQTAIAAIPMAQFTVQLAGLDGPTPAGDPAVLVGTSGTLTPEAAIINGQAVPAAMLEQTVGASTLQELAYTPDIANSIGPLDATTNSFEVSLHMAGAQPCGVTDTFDLDAYALDSTHLFLIYLHNVDDCGNFEELSGTAQQ